MKHLLLFIILPFSLSLYSNEWMEEDWYNPTDTTESQSIELSAKEDTNGILLTWEVRQEKDLKYYQIYRSIDFSSFSKLATVNVTESKQSVKNYQYLDTAVNKKVVKTVSYRLYQNNTTSLSASAQPVSGTSLSLTTTISDLLPQITPKSPNVAAIERFGNYPVSHYTGIPQIEIPIYEIQLEGMTIPVKLTYHAGGNKVADNASWIGLGWSLSCEYAITREVRGIPDEHINGLLGEPMFPDLLEDTCLTLAIKNSYLDYMQNGDDAERDIFSYKTPLRSNSFILTQDSFLFQELEKSKISYLDTNHILQYIVLTDEHGNNYKFQHKEFSTVGGTNLTSSWMLNEIQGNSPTDKVIFTYTDNGLFDVTGGRNYFRTYNYERYNTPMGIGAGLVDSGYVNRISTIDSERLDTIFFPNGMIVFVPSTSTRQDGFGKSLTEIEIYGYDFSSSSYTMIRQYELVQSYRTRIGSSDKVLFLDTVKMLNTDNSLEGKYTISYNSQALPVILSNPKDYWGYYNGESNSDLIPQNSFTYHPDVGNPTTVTTTVGAADRSPNESLMKAWIIDKITYPTGGFTTFDFEANRYSDSGTPTIVGGLRIKSIISNDGNGITTSKYFKYGSNGTGTLRDISPRIDSITQKYKDGGNYSYMVRNYSSDFISPLYPKEGVVVTYPTVTEYDDSDSTNGKTIYQFKDDVNDIWVFLSSTGRQLLKSIAWNRGQLLNKTFYGSDGDKKREEIYTYQTLAGNTTETLGYLIGRDHVNIGTPLFSGDCLVEDDVFRQEPYDWIVGVVKMTKSETKDYDDTNDSKYVYKKMDYGYNGYFQLKEEKSYNSDGDIRVRQIRYCTDFNNLSSSLSGGALAVHNLMERNQLTTPIEILKLRTSGVSTRVLEGQFTVFDNYTFSSKPYLIKDSIYLLEVSPNTVLDDGDFDYADVDMSGDLIRDSHYFPRLVFDFYNSYAKVKSYHQIAGSQTEVNRATTSKNGVYHDRVSTQVLNNNGSPEYITTFDIDIPLLGPNEITAPNGTKASFEYDKFGRLLRSKDDNGDLLAEYEYSYPYKYVSEYMPRSANESLDSFHIIRQFYDGLGRPIQKMHIHANPAENKHIIMGAVIYDAFGRPDSSYLDFSASGTSSQAATIPSTIHNDAAPYSHVSLYDNSPLNRPKKLFGAGKNWRTEDKYVEKKYQVETSGVINKYVVTSSGATSTTYGANQIYKNTTISEQGNAVIEYLDNDGKLIQTNEQDGPSSYRITQYIYDVYDRLRYVIQPNESSVGSFSETYDEFTDGIFAYEYDKRGRVIKSHVPGGGWTYTAYDLLDRPVMYQDDLQQDNNNWIFTHYDALGRIGESYLVSSPYTRSIWQNWFDGITQAYDQWSGSAYGTSALPNQLVSATKEKRILNIYDTHPSFGSSFNFDGSHAYHSNYSNVKGQLAAMYSYENSDTSYRSVFYYDDKNRMIQSIGEHHLGSNIRSWKYTFPGEIEAEKTTFTISDSVYTHIDSFTYDHVGRQTSFWAGTNFNPQLYCSSTYDDFGRLITKKYLPNGSFGAGGGVDYIYRPPNPLEVTADTARKAIIMGPGAEINLEYSADIDTTLDDTQTINALQTIDYTYNIRQWLIGINLNASYEDTPNSSQGDLFSLKLEYDSVGRYDGNIGKQSWTLAGNASFLESSHSYTYSYDKSNRISSADYSGQDDYDLESISYDKNGNIMSLIRHGDLGGSFGIIDSLTYSYDGNMLMQVEDTVTGDHGVDFVNRSSASNEYDYYSNGALLKDLNENIDEIEYDLYLMKPKQINLTDGSWIKFRYDGEGTLLRRELSDGTIWDYVNQMQLRNGEPYQIATPEGRMVYDSAWYPEFEYRDHLGNLRVAFTERDGSLQMTQASDYDPTGVSFNHHAYTPKQQHFEFNGYETQNDFGLRRIDYVNRGVNPTICRFDRIDRFAGKFMNQSPYIMSAGDPVNYVDFGGDSIIPTKALLDNEEAYAGFLEFFNSDESTLFVELFGDNGKYGSIPVYFDVLDENEQDDAADNGLTRVFAIDKESGESTQLIAEEVASPSQRSKLNANEKLSYQIDVSPFGTSLTDPRNVINTGLRFLHESQHILLANNDLQKTGKLVHGPVVHHQWMNMQDYFLFKQRFDYYRKRRPDLSIDEINKAVWIY